MHIIENGLAWKTYIALSHFDNTRDFLAMKFYQAASCYLYEVKVVATYRFVFLMIEKIILFDNLNNAKTEMTVLCVLVLLHASFNFSLTLVVAIEF